MNPPKQRREFGPTWLREVRRDISDLTDYARSLQIVNSPTVKANRAAIGTSLQAAAASASSRVEFYVVKTVMRDYLLCNACTLEDDGTITESGEEDAVIAKPTTLQPWLFDGETIDGVLYTLTYGDSGTEPLNPRAWTGQHRTFKRGAASRYTVADSNAAFAVTFKQTVWPFYEPDKSIIAVSELVSGDAMTLPEEEYIEDGETVTLPALTTAKIDLNIDGRHWADVYREIQFCDPDLPAEPGKVTCLRFRASETYQSSV